MKLDITNYLPLTILVTNTHLAGGVDPLVSIVADAIDGGINAVQLREKTMDYSRQLDLASQLRQVTQDRALLFINSELEIAQIVGADGIQIPESGITQIEEMAEYHENMYFGCSVHSIKAAESGISHGADFLIAGTIFRSPSHEEATGSGVTLIEKTVQRAKVPVVGIGGINPANAAEVIYSGAAGVAVISEIIQASDPQATAAELVRIVNNSWNSRFNSDD